MEVSAEVSALISSLCEQNPYAVIRRINSLKITHVLVKRGEQTGVMTGLHSNEDVSRFFKGVSWTVISLFVSMNFGK
jgi:hypothetical protein